MILLKPQPMALDTQLRSERDIARHRRLYCKQYDGCLDESIRQGWQSFTCCRCPLSDQAADAPQPNSFAEDRHRES